MIRDAMSVEISLFAGKRGTVGVKTGRTGPNANALAGKAAQYLILAMVISRRFMRGLI